MDETIPPLAPGAPELAPVIRKVRGEYILCCRTRLPRPREEIFNFFSDARNLERITPDLLRFQVITEGDIVMKTGTLIDYRLRIRGIPIRWRTRISAWEPPCMFEDTQLKGPYRQWIHQHTFIDEGDSTLMEDRVRYKVLGGAIVHRLAVRRDVLQIFTSRNRTMGELFPAT
ncbi:MAG: SRPBCC family protein [Phycisphaerales bacterium]|nr:SRPBCC family protein [Phycisphaerales bacterium]